MLKKLIAFALLVLFVYVIFNPWLWLIAGVALIKLFIVYIFMSIGSHLFFHKSVSDLFFGDD